MRDFTPVPRGATTMGGGLWRGSGRPAHWRLLAGAILIGLAGCTSPAGPSDRLIHSSEATTASIAPTTLEGARRIELRASGPGSAGAAPLVAWLFEPASSHEPKAAVLALHGCGGLYSRRGELSSRHRRGVEQLLNQGLIVLMPDSFGSRGLREICSLRYRDRTIDIAQRHRDALAGLAYLRDVLAISPERTALLGWSNGATTVLALIATTDSDTRPASTPRSSAGPHQPAGPAFARAVAFYPGCAAARQERLVPTVPVLLLLGAADDWTPASTCQAWAARVRDVGSATVELEVYAGAHHGFDTPGSTLTRRTDVPHAPDGRGVTMGGHPEARERSWARVRDWLGPLSQP